MVQAGLGPDVNGPWQARPRNTADKWSRLGWAQTSTGLPGPGLGIQLINGPG